MDQRIDFQHTRLTPSNIQLSKTILWCQMICAFFPCLIWAAKFSGNDSSQQSHTHWFMCQICMALLINQYELIDASQLLFHSNAGWYCPLLLTSCSCGHLGGSDSKRSLWRLPDGTQRWLSALAELHSYQDTCGTGSRPQPGEEL